MPLLNRKTKWQKLLGFEKNPCHTKPNTVDNSTFSTRGAETKAFPSWEGGIQWVEKPTENHGGHLVTIQLEHSSHGILEDMERS